MKRIIFITFLMLLASGNIGSQSAQASFVSDRMYRLEQNKIQKNEIKQIKKMILRHTELANKHDIEALKPFYADFYMNNDGFNKEIYFKNVQETWEECSDLTYKVDIVSIDVKGDYADVTLDEIATGTVFETMELGSAAGEIHSKSREISHLKKINGEWVFTGDTSISDESSLLYGDARFLNIELMAPSQVAAGEEYTVSVKVDTDNDAYIIGSIAQDLVTYPTKNTEPPLRVFPKSQILERVLKANSDNLNEYAVASMAISKTASIGFDRMRVYMAGLACVMKRINVIPKNNFANLEEKDESNSN